MDKDIPYSSTQKKKEISLEEPSVNSLNMPYVNDCTYPSQ